MRVFKTSAAAQASREVTAQARHRPSRAAGGAHEASRWPANCTAVLLSVLAASAPIAAPPTAGAAGESPYALAAKGNDYGLLNGRIRACQGNLNPNCVSTSSLTGAYAPAWRAPEGMDTKEAIELIKDTVMRVGGAGSRVLADEVVAEGATRYVRISVPSKKFPEDVVEFLIKPEGVTDRNWEGDRPGALVLYRSIAGGVKYLYPLTQPIGDGNAQQKRMQTVRAELGWKLVGCELIECYGE
ncbi:unnamed protein product [Pedinophyceae sp. YPF-701]|nr:unnamed protein product [Pedinophyceae sp. YPF-701]